MVARLPERHEGLLVAHEPGRRAVAGTLGDFGKGQADGAQPVDVHRSVFCSCVDRDGTSRAAPLPRLRRGDALRRTGPILRWPAISPGPRRPLDQARAAVAAFAAGDPLSPGWFQWAIERTADRAHIGDLGVQPAREPDAGRAGIHARGRIPGPGVRHGSRPRRSSATCSGSRGCTRSPPSATPGTPPRPACWSGPASPPKAAGARTPGSRTSGPTTFSTACWPRIRPGSAARPRPAAAPAASPTR